MTLTQFLLILKARWKVAVLALAITVLTTLVVSLVLPKQYTSSAAVVVDVRQPDAITGAVMGGFVNAGYMATQVDIINSDRVARTVVQQLRMDQSPVIQAQWREATDGKGQLIDWLAPLLRKNLDVLPSRESNVITIQYTGVDPAFAATVANAFAQAYIAVTLDLRVAPARQFASFFEEQTQAARERLEASQKKLSDYLKEHGITSADQRLDVETARLNEISSQLTVIQGQTTDSGSKRQTGQSSQADTLSEVINNPLINSLKSDVARTEAKLQEASIHQGPKHPTSLRLQEELASLKTQLDAETRKVINSVNTSYQVGRQREQQLQSALAAQRNRVLQLNQQRDEVLVLQREVDTAQRAFDAVSQRATQTNVESQANQTNVSLLTAAVAPLDPSKPKVFLNLLVSVFLGTMLGVGLALVLELIDRRVRSAQDLTDTLNLPVLGTIGQAAGTIKNIQAGAPA